MALYCYYLLIAVVSIGIVNIGSGFVCLSADHPVPICLTPESNYMPWVHGYRKVREFYLAQSHEDCQNPKHQKCCKTWQLYPYAKGWEFNELIGYAHECKDMDPEEQCPDVMPNQNGKRFYPDGIEVPSPYDPSCFFTAEGNGNNENPTTLVEISSDGIDDNLSADIFSSPT